MSEKVSENYLSEDTYINLGVSLKKWFLIIFSLLLIGFVINFPLLTVIDGQIQAAIEKSANKKCPFTVGKISYGAFLPKISLQNVFLPGSCFNKPQSQLVFPAVHVSLSGLSFSPFGLKVNAQTKLEGSPLEAQAIVGLGKYFVRIEDNNIDTATLATFEPNISKVSGSFKVNGLVELNAKGLQGGDFRLESNNFSVLPISYFGMGLHALNINKVVIQGEIQKQGSKQVLIFQDKDGKKMGINIGTQDGPLMANLRGSIELNQFNMKKSQLKLQTEIKIGKQITDELPLIDSLLNGALSKKDEFYQGKIGGTLGKPKISKL
jgi:hypothetical protein